MPVTKSAIKAMKQANTAKERNRATKADFRGKVKVVRKDVVAGGKEAEKVLATAMQAIDKAAKKGVIHKKAAARRKSRLMLAVNKALGKAVVVKATKAKAEKPTSPAKKAAPKKKTTTKKEA